MSIVVKSMICKLEFFCGEDGTGEGVPLNLNGDIQNVHWNRFNCDVSVFAILRELLCMPI